MLRAYCVELYVEASHCTEVTKLPFFQHHQNGMDKPHEKTNKKVTFSHPGHLPGFGSRYTEITWGRLCAVVAVAGGRLVKKI